MVYTRRSARGLNQALKRAMIDSLDGPLTMRMHNPGRLLAQPSECVALKDEQLIYRACSSAFARRLGFDTPDQIIGRTDFELFPARVAQEQRQLDAQVLYAAQADISSVEFGQPPVQHMIVRSPVIGPDRTVRGIDLRLLGGTRLNAPRSAIAIDHELLVSEGLQGSLIFGRHDLLFANDNAARTFGFGNGMAMVDQATVHQLLSDEELARLSRHAMMDEEQPQRAQRLNLRAMDRRGRELSLLARAVPVQWGSVQATLLSFVDIRHAAAASVPESELVPRVDGSAMLAAGATATTAIAQPKLAEQRYRHFANAAADLFWETDELLKYRYLSDGFQRVFGIPDERVIGRRLEQMLDYPANVNPPGHWDEHLDQLADMQPFRDFEFRWVVEGETKVIRISGLPVFDEDRNFIGYRGTGNDVTASVRQAETLAFHANHDALTGLVNRRRFSLLVENALRSAREERRAHALFFMDLDGFKVVNDTAGHEAGDELLRQLGQLFDSLVRKSDALGRIGGDEFAVLLYNCSVAEALKLANQIRNEVEQFQFVWRETRFVVGVSIGLVVVDDRWDDMAALFRAADSACYIAKDEGRNRVVVYREGEGHHSNRQVATHWVEKINNALETGRVRIACQKIKPLHDQPDGLRFEIFLRLLDEQGQQINPAAFLPTAERYGLSPVLDERTVDLTIAWLLSNPDLLHSLRHVSINLASASFTKSEFTVKLRQKVLDSGIAPEKFCFELSETATVANLTDATAFMQSLSAIGCRFTIDDFGSGLSSFAYLRKLPIDFLKIDGRLVRDILDDPTDYTMVKAIGEISRSLGKRTVAEFVETPRLMNAVRDIGIDFAQGFHVGEPELVES